MSHQRVLGLLRGRLSRNIATNYLAVLWIGALTLALIPWYTQRLSAEQWGLVAVCIALQGIMTLLDAGLSQIMPREIARASGSRKDVAQTFGVFARAYLILALIGFAAGQAVAPWIAQRWLNASPETAGDATLALRILLVQFLFQFTNNANIGYWNGMQAQATANARQCLFATAKHVGAMALIHSWQPVAVAYLLPFALGSALEWLSNRRAVLASLDINRLKQAVTWNELASLARETGVLAASVFLGMLISLIDRIVLSGSVDLADFGRYVIAANLGLAFMQLQHPLVRAFLPKLATAASARAATGLRQMGTAIVLLCVLPSLLAAFLAPQILQLWIGNPVIVEQGILPLRLILTAVALNGLYQVIYQQLILISQAALIFRINFLILIIVVPVSITAVARYGIAGGGMTWLTVSALQLLLGWLYLKKATA